MNNNGQVIKMFKHDFMMKALFHIVDDCTVFLNVLSAMFLQQLS